MGSCALAVLDVRFPRNAKEKKDRSADGAEPGSSSSADDAESRDEGSGLYQSGRGKKAGPQRQLSQPSVLRDDRPEGGARGRDLPGNRRRARGNLPAHLPEDPQARDPG